MPDKKLTDKLSNNSPILSNGLSDSEIVKGLEKQANEKRCTFEQYEEACGMWCKYHHKWCADMSGIDNKQNCADYTPSSATRIAKATLDLINRQKAENERLKENLNIELENYATEYDYKIKAEAYKECIEKVKEEIKQALESNYKARAEIENKDINLYLDDLFWNYCSGKIHCLRGLDDFLDNLLKEMEGDNNA